MSNSIITLKNHFNGNDTIVVNIEGKIIVHNGCQTFELASLDYVCDEFDVPAEDREDVIEAVERISGHHKDLINLVQISHKFLKYIKHQTDDICIAAIRNSAAAWAYVNIERSDEFHIKLVAQAPGQLQYIDNQTPEICMTAVQQNGYALYYVREQTPEICLAAVKQNGFALRFVKEQTPEMCMIAIKYHWSTICYVDEQTPELCMAAVELDGKALLYVKEQTPEICLAAVKQTKEAEKYVTIELV